MQRNARQKGKRRSIRSGKAEEKSGDQQHQAQSAAQEGERGTPAHRRVIDERARKIAQHQGGSAEAHHQRAGAGAFLVGKPRAGGGDDDVISDADARAAEDAVAHVEHGDALPGEPGGEQKARAGEQGRQDQGEPGTQTEKAHG